MYQKVRKEATFVHKESYADIFACMYPNTQDQLSWCPLLTNTTVFENHRKSLIQDCERSELRLQFDWTNVSQKCQKKSILASFCKPEACGQTVFPDRSFLIGQKLVENAKIKKNQMRHFE